MVKDMNQFAGRYHDSEIQQVVCNTYIHNGKHMRHFEAGEKGCTKCRLFFKLTWIHLYCPQCGTRLRSSSRYRKRQRNVVAY